MRNHTMNKAMGLVVALAAFGAVACGATKTASRSTDAGITSSAEMQAFLEDTHTAASYYGRRKLGHFLKLDERALRKNGLDVPPGTELVIRTNHEGYCIEASTSRMPTDAVWSSATLSSGFEGASSKDRCRL